MGVWTHWIVSLGIGLGGMEVDCALKVVKCGMAFFGTVRAGKWHYLRRKDVNLFALLRILAGLLCPMMLD